MGGVVGGVPPAVQWDTTNWLFAPLGVKVADADVNVAPAPVTTKKNDVFPLWSSSGLFVTVVPSENDALIVAPACVWVRLNCQVCVPPGAGG